MNAFEDFDARIAVDELNRESPGYVRKQLVIPNPFRTTLDDYCTVGSGEAYTQPVLIESPLILRRRTLPPQKTSPGFTPLGLCVCGYQPGQWVNVLIADPTGMVMLEQRVQAKPAIRGVDLDPSINCVSAFETGTLEFVPTDPYGDIMVQFTSDDAQIIHRVSLVPPHQPVVYYSDRLKSYVLAGFDPSEEVLVWVYELGAFTLDSADVPTTLIGSARLTLDQNGVGLIGPADKRFEVMALGKADHYASSVATSSMRLDDLGMVAKESANPTMADALLALDTISLLASDPNSSTPYYLNARLVRGADLGSARQDLTRAIELDPAVAEYYAARGLVAVTFGDAFSDFTQAIELDPELAEAYFWRGQNYESRIDPDAIALAISDYERVLEIATDPDLISLAAMRLAELRQ